MRLSTLRFNQNECGSCTFEIRIAVAAWRGVAESRRGLSGEETRVFSDTSTAHAATAFLQKRVHVRHESAPE